jgi:hypothetical protein
MAAPLFCLNGCNASAWESLNMADILQGVLFILACVFLYGLTAFLFRDQIMSSC